MKALPEIQVKFRLLAVLILTPLVWAQAPLALSDAVRTALDNHPSLEAGAARVKAARTRIEQAHGNFLPKVNYTEMFARSNNPVFVFSSLLTQHQFTEKNFAIGPLNRPDAMNNFQSVLSVDQVIYDAGQIRPVIFGRYPLDRVAEALEALAGRRTHGKVVLVP